MTEPAAPTADSREGVGLGQAEADPLATGSFSDPVSSQLSDFMRESWARQPDLASPPAPPSDLLRDRRDRLRRELPARLPAVIPAGVAPRRVNDQFYSFRASSDYVWLAGDQTPAGVLILDPESAAGDVLFLPPPSRRDNGEFFTDAVRGELWVGPRPSLEGRAEELGITCRPLGELEQHLSGLGEALISRSYDPAVEAQVTAAENLLDRELTAVLSEDRKSVV